MAAVASAQVQRLGIFGGTFDPIHHGHLVAAAEARFQLDLDRVLFVPARVPPHKPAQPISAASHRLRMVELAIATNPHFALSRVDVDRPAPSYTVETLELLRAEWGPGPRFFFIEGPDSLSDIVCWYQPQRLIELCELAVVARPGSNVDLAGLERQLPGLTDRLHWVEMPLLEISSTDVRARARTGRPISYLVPHGVEAYIRQHGLYRE
ncbi:MAG: nicotinate-nucleotide adenylyltransferase [Anaerolineae bacterium]